jgi:hypothetical protein
MDHIYRPSPACDQIRDKGMDHRKQCLTLTRNLLQKLRQDAEYRFDRAEDACNVILTRAGFL